MYLFCFQYGFWCLLRSVNQCPAFSLPQHAVLLTSPCPTYYGAKCRVACDPGYRLNTGASTVDVTCETSGTSYAWDSAPTCTRECLKAMLTNREPR